MDAAAPVARAQADSRAVGHRHTGRLRHGPGDTARQFRSPTVVACLGRTLSRRRRDPPSLRAVFQRLAEIRLEPPPRPRSEGLLMPILAVGRAKPRTRESPFADFVVLLGQLLLDAIFLFGILHRCRGSILCQPFPRLVCERCRSLRWSAFIGVVLSYLSALQLKAFGADVFIVEHSRPGYCQELGPVLVSVLVAGRSGSAMTAQLGVMRVTEEIDAFVDDGHLALFETGRAQGRGLDLRDALAGALDLGGCALRWHGVGADPARHQLQLLHRNPCPAWCRLPTSTSRSPRARHSTADRPRRVPLRVAGQTNTESLSANTTASVVSAITVVILVDAIFAIATRNVGVPI